MTRFARLVLPGLAVTLLLRPALRAADSQVAWLTGEKLRVALDQKIGVTWANIPLRRALTSLSKSRQVAIILDRRVDPDQKIELTFDDVPLDIALKRIAERAKIGVGQVGSVFYFGPEVSARRIRTLSVLAHEELRKLPAAVRLRLLQLRPWGWDEATAPRDLLDGLALQCDVKFEGLDRIPHDLWAASDLPPLIFTDRLTLVASQFDLTFHFSADGETVKLVDVPETVATVHAYAIPSDPAQVAMILQKLREVLPDAKFEVVDRKLVVRGRSEDQEFVETYLSGRTARTVTVVPGAKKVYQLSIVMPVGKLVKTLGPRLDLDVRIDEAAIDAAGLSLKKEVKVDVKDASADQLLTAVLAPAGLTFDRQGRVVKVHPKK
jgi:hypothetical protein